MSDGQASAVSRVARRRVFYIPGYDPFHPRRYRELYRKEAAAQAAVSGHEIAVAGRPGAEVYGWDVTATIEGARIESGFEVLIWSDIVRASMRAGIAATYLLMARTAWVNIRSGALAAMLRLRRGPVFIAGFYPVVMLLGQLALALLMAWGVSALAGLWLPGWLGWALGLALVWPLMAWFKARDGRLYAYYLLNDYAFSARLGGAYPPELEARIAGFAVRIREALAGGADEVLVVGHSSGAHVAVSVLADLVRAGVVPDDGRLAFLTLGQAIPMAAFLPYAYRLRSDIQVMSEQESIFWLDVSAPGDGCCFALCDPVAVTGVARPGRQRWPLVISAAFTQTLSPATWARLKRRFFRLHFQYLCAFDRPGDYD
ncbi:MAG: hypothetical protein CVT80_14650, partial [Alphaproteobacteria bacterium HGW-Alphaproteobacteria-2]